MIRAKPSAIQRYGLAVAVTVLALLARWLLEPALGSASPFLLFAPAVMISAWYGGLGPGILSTLIATLASELFFLHSDQSVLAGYPQSLARLGVFFLVSLLISFLVIPRRRAEEALRQTNDTLQALIQASPLAIVSLDPDGNVRRWNEAAERIFGWAEKDVLGKPYPAIPAGGEQEFRTNLDLALTGVPFAGLEVQRARANGTLIDIASWTAPLHDHSGKINGVMSLMADITERLEIERERGELLAREQEARRQAERANRVRDEFLAMVSHELRTPLTGVRGWADLLRTGKLDEESARRALNSIIQNADIQAKLISDLLDSSRMLAGKFRLDTRPVGLEPIIEAATEVVRPMAAVKRIQLTHVFGATDSAVSGDPDRLQQVFWNLLTNAVKFTPEGGRVEVRVERSDSTVRISVSDNGKGITAESLPHVFERFYQAEDIGTRTHRGLGLGLAIVRHIVEMHGGEVAAESAGPGHGTTMKVKLPLMAAAPGEQESDGALSTPRFVSA